jgi:1-acyl-sn-glycerol-3-phosphate acyltransferase
MIRSLVFTALMYLTIPPYALATLLVRPAGVAASYRVCVAWARMITALCGRVCGLHYRIEGRENLPATPGVALMKHSSAYETIAQMLVFPAQCWVLKRELMWTPFFGWALAAVKPIAINRQAGHGAVAQVVEQGRFQLAQGRWVMVFPEGTRMAPGETRRYGVSGTLLAQRAGCLVVPLAHNAGEFWPRRGLMKRPGTVVFAIGPAMDPAGRDPREFNEEVQRWIEAKVAELRAASR